MIKLILIISMLVITEASSLFTMLPDVDNSKRLEKCGILEHRSKRNHKTIARDAPWLVRIHYSKNESKSFSTGVMISKRHILTDYIILNLYDNIEKLKKTDQCENGVIDLNSLGITGREKLKVEVELCEDFQDCKTSHRFDAPLIAEQLFGDCSIGDSLLLLIEIGIDLPLTPICLPNHKKPLKDEPVTLQIFNKFPASRGIIKFCEKFICTKESVVDVSNDFGVGMSAKRAGRETLVAIGKHSYLPPKDGTGGFIEISELHENAICRFTGICPPLESSESPGILETSEAPSAPTEKSRIIVDWPPPLPSIRPAIREPTVDHLPQTDEEYEYENQLLMEYEQIEKEDLEKEKEEKKGKERWNVLVAVGVTVLIGLI